ncbi:TIGR01777 family oxidoreductase [Pantoea piersonii]|uniref:TIGR01777 family oxidoreductase n=1 Tax=Pantoea piersonii TaxID=2364647 RepID=UPI0022F19733|nr:TIGR01777 family oxidoreductase [Pantoea piersonii]WBV22655.1 TIGR01777 family oxidoreductase [Pantoea piersonii]
MHILMTGGTGLIGRHLIPRLLTLGHQVSVVTRDVAAAREKLDAGVALWSGLAQQQNLDGIDAVINLAGEPIADKRWTEQQKQLLCESRWQITERIASLINASHSPPRVLISGSATGYYGDTGELVMTEEDQGQEEFTHSLCARWEQLALSAQSERTRVCLMRTGVVLANEGGALSKMKLPFRLGVGGPIGSGKQYLPWIHIDDMVNAILWLLDHDELSGPFNMVAPYAVRNEQFAATLGHVMHRPAFMRTPASAIKMMMGESAVLVLGGQHVLPKRLEASGFGFRWYDLQEALQDVVGKPAGKGAA